MDKTKFHHFNSNYYSSKLKEFGASAKGVDWKSEEAQIIRFQQLAKLLPNNSPFTVLDYGSGYGALYGFLRNQFTDFEYKGYDINPECAQLCAEAFGKNMVTDTPPKENEFDYVIASGVFNLKGEFTIEEWTNYVLSELDILNKSSKKGFAFNMLTSWSDEQRQQANLYYADPTFFFRHCKLKYSENIALLHDYGMWDFTILVRK
jgi:cyclopropane fatty-acyl-phospholipid synthase-like methyltransferase